MTLRRWIPAILTAYVALALLLLLLPVSYGDMTTGIWNRLDAVVSLPFGAGWVEFAANIVLFLPLGLLLTLLLRHPWRGAALAVGLSVCVELAQAVIPERHPMMRDIVSNGIGAALGGALAWALVLRRRRREARRRR